MAPSQVGVFLTHLRRLTTHIAVALITYIFFVQNGASMRAAERRSVVATTSSSSLKSALSAVVVPQAPQSNLSPTIVSRMESTIKSACVACVEGIVPAPLAVSEGEWAIRGSRANVHKYIELSMSDQISGFMNFPTHAAFAIITRVQQQAGVTGAVGEIGVHHGRSFILAALLSAPNEPLWMLDLFETLQGLNIDHSGEGNYDAVRDNLAKVGLNASDITTVRSSSLDITSAAFCDAHLPLFRWFSVDGGHTEEATRHDMHLGACHLAQGGVIAVDDVFNNLFLGVTEGIFNFINFNRDRVAPFFIITGKMYLTTPSHHARYLDAVTSFFTQNYNAYVDSEKTLIGGWLVLSHSVPVHADIESRPDKGERIKLELNDILRGAFETEARGVVVVQK